MSQSMTKTIACLLVFNILAVPVLTAGTPWRSLSAQEKANTRGAGWWAACTTIEKIGVVGAVCSAISLGWDVIKEFYDGQTSGNEVTEPCDGTTPIRQATQNTGSTCQKIEQYDYVQEFRRR